MTDHTITVLLAATNAVLIAAGTGFAAGFLARRDHASYPHAITRAAATFAATLSLITALIVAWTTLAR